MASPEAILREMHQPDDQSVASPEAILREMRQPDDQSVASIEGILGDASTGRSVSGQH